MSKAEKTILGILPSLGGSIASQKKDGREGLFLNYYIPAYLREFKAAYYFSFADEANLEIPDFFIFKNRLRLHRYLYALLIPLIYQSKIRECSLIRVMHTNGAISAVLAKLFWGVPFVATYGYDYVNFARIEGYPIKAFLLSLILPIILKLADGVIVTTEELKRAVSKMIGSIDRICSVPNGTDTNRFTPKDKKEAGSPFKFLFVGRLERQKNISFLFDVIGDLQKKYPIELVMIGDGSLRDELKARVEKEGLPVRFLGSVSYEAMPVYHNRSDCFISTSLAEGHPKALIEAMSSALPCVVSKSPGNTMLIRHDDNGLLLDFDRSLWVEELSKLILDVDCQKKLGNAARKWIMENLDLEHTLTKELDFLLKKARFR